MFERVETPRLILRRPVRADAEAIFARYANDPEVTRLVGWPRHTSLDQTHGFLDFSDAQWTGWPAGPYLVESRHDGSLLGSTGLGFETSERAMTGYVFARDEWGKGYATECLRAVVNIARDLGVVRLYALCHPENPASWHVLEKCGFVCEGVWPKHTGFPNLSQEELCDVLCYACILNRSSLPDLRVRVQRNRGDAESLHILGVMLAERGEYRRSFICHRAAAATRPEDPKYLYHSGNTALTLGRADDAAWYLDKTLSIDPGHLEAWQARGQLYADHFKLPDEALRSYVKAIGLASRDPDNYRSAARCVLRTHGRAAAVARLRDAIPASLHSLDVDRGLASALVEAGHYEYAVPILDGIIRQRPGDLVSMRFLAEVYTGLHDWDATQSWYERAISGGDEWLAAVGYVIHWSRLGDFDRAREVYRTYKLGARSNGIPESGLPRWHGQNIKGKTLRLIGGDRYFGDPLQYSRFAREAKEAGATVILQGPKRLRSLLRTIPGVDSVVAPHDPVPPLDYEAVAFWLLWDLSVPVAEIGQGPYLQAPADLRVLWKKQIAPAAGINVGIVWRGSRNLVGDRFRYRSIRLEELRPLAAIPGVTLYSLQCGEGRTELLEANPPFPAVDLAPDFPNTAAAMEALDLVVTIDTSMAHLAGALGKQTFLMLPYNPCFRWMVNRDDTPWYPAMRLFRQTVPGQWSDVVTAVSQAIKPQAIKPQAIKQ